MPFGRQNRVTQGALAQHRWANLIGACVLVVLLLFSASTGFGQAFDTVLANGRVMDPETGLDAIRNVGIKGKLITEISTNRLLGTTTIDASGLVIAPGFIDLHQHGQ